MREARAITEGSPSSVERTRANEFRRRNYAKEAPKYDKQMGFFERRLFGTLTWDDASFSTVLRKVENPRATVS